MRYMILYNTFTAQILASRKSRIYREKHVTQLYKTRSLHLILTGTHIYTFNESTENPLPYCFSRRISFSGRTHAQQIKSFAFKNDVYILNFDILHISNISKYSNHLLMHTHHTHMIQIYWNFVISIRLKQFLDMMRACLLVNFWWCCRYSRHSTTLFCARAYVRHTIVH